MNNLVIPPSANWYESAILTCAPDGTLIYGSRNDIVIIYDSPVDQPTNIKIINRAHSQKIISTNINKNWGNPHKLLVTASEDNIIKLWDIETGKKKLGHNAHIGHSKVIGATFAGDDKVISVSEEGIIVVWNITQNQTTVLKEIFGQKTTITCISTCPHASWLTAFGLKNGLVIVTDLRKQGRVIHKLRGHDKPVLSLAWCPVPINIFPKDPNNYVVVKDSESNDIKNTNEASNDMPAEAGEGDKYESSGSETLKNGEDSDHCENKQEIMEENKSGMIEEKHENEKESDVSQDEKSPAGDISDTSDEKCDGEKVVSEETNVEVKNVDGTKSDDKVEENNIEDTKKITTQNHDKTIIDLKDTDLHEVVKKVDDQKNPVEDNTGIIDENCPDEKIIFEGTEAEEEIITNVGKVKESDVEDTDKITTEEHDQKSDLQDNDVCEDEKKVAEDNTGIIDEKCADEVVVLEETGSEEKTVHGTKNADNVEESDVEGTKKMTTAEAKREIIPTKVPMKEEPRREFLLASSGKEQNIYIWRAGTDGRMQTFLSLPGKRKLVKKNYDKLWIVLCWVSPTVLLSTSKTAEIVTWKLPKPKDKSKECSILNNDHSSIVFSIAAPQTFWTEKNFQEQKNFNIWSFGHDRKLLNISLSSDKKILACYPTIGNAEVFSPSPVDPNRLAIGTAEGIIKIWDLSRENIKKIVMSDFYQKIQGKVVALAWHPTDELILAYATQEGRVGFLDIGNKSKAPIVVTNTSQVHRIEWGPVSGKSDFGLYAATEGKLVVFNNKKSEKDFTEVDIPEDTFVYTFAWKPDHSALLVGTKTGAVIAFSPDMKIIFTHYFQHRLKHIEWHPEATQSDSTTFKHCHWFAAISNSKDVIICNFQKDIEDGNKIIAKYEYSGDVINCIAWSPYTSEELLFTTDDGLVQVWNVENDSVSCTYTTPCFEGISCAVWSPVNSDCIVSGSKDHTIRVWRISEHPTCDIEEVKELRKKVVKEIANEQFSLLPKTNKVQEQPQKSKKVSKTNLMSYVCYTKDTSDVINNLKKLLLWKEGLNVGQNGGGGDGNVDILKIFGSKSDMLEIIERNERIHQERGKYSSSNTLSLFRGDIGGKIKKAIEEKRVNPWIIMMAPMVSPKVWQAACDVYAQQLSESTDSDPIEIATFYLACHKVDEAIDALCEGSMFCEALSLAKCRLPEDSPIVVKIMERWVKFSMFVGNFEEAAKCYIYLGKYEDAASALFRRSEPETLKFAVELAEKSGNEDLHKAVLFRYNAFNKNDISEVLVKTDTSVSDLETVNGDDDNKT